jgi:hypothetical protein
MCYRVLTVLVSHGGLVTEPYEIKIPGEGDREGYMARERAGEWMIEAWWPLGARGGPHELRLYPADDADPGRVARGISHAVLNAVPLAKMTAGIAKAAPAAEALRDQLGALDEASRRRGRSPAFYLAIAAEYVALTAAGERQPVQAIARRTGKSGEAVRGWIRTARTMGYLTGEPGRTAGELTPAANELLSQMEPFKPYQPGGTDGQG